MLLFEICPYQTKSQAYSDKLNRLFKMGPCRHCTARTIPRPPFTISPLIAVWLGSIWRVITSLVCRLRWRWRRRNAVKRRAMVTTTIRLRFHRAALRLFDDLRYDRRSTCVRAASLRTKWKSAQRDANTARAGCSKVRTPRARPLYSHKPTDRTDYNTLRRSVINRSAWL